MNYNFLNNSFKNESIAFDLTLTADIILDENIYETIKTTIKKDSSVTNLAINLQNISDTTAVIPGILNTWKLKKIPVTAFKKGRDQMKITEWGPYNYSYPILFLKKTDSNQVYHFDVLGPKGKWKIKRSKDVHNISMNEGSFPAAITAQKKGVDVQIQLEYTGEAFTDLFGKDHPANRAYDFGFRDFQPEINWQVNWYSWDSLHNPNKNYELFKTVFNNKPVRSEQSAEIDYTWWGTIGKNMPADSFAIVATGTVEVEKGNYILSVTADDLVKIFVDEKLVIDFWDVTKYKYDEDTHHEATVQLNGKHTIRVEQAENSGYATLIFKLIPLNNTL